jgi:hypothetical protein
MGESLRPSIIMVGNSNILNTSTSGKEFFDGFLSGVKAKVTYKEGGGISTITSSIPWGR